MKELIVLGAIQGAHGVKGLVKIKWFTENPKGLTAYGPVILNDIKALNVDIKFVTKNYAVCSLEGVETREQAEYLKGKEIKVERSILPDLKDNEYYQTDLVDCKVYNLKGKKIGEVATVYDFGAGVLLEVGEDLVQFNEENIKEVDIINKKIVKKI